MYESFEGYGSEESILGQPLKGEGLIGPWEKRFTDFPQKFEARFDGLFFAGYPSADGALTQRTGATQRGTLVAAFDEEIKNTLLAAGQNEIELWLSFLWETASPDSNDFIVGLGHDVSGVFPPPWAFGIVTNDPQGFGQIVGGEKTLYGESREEFAPSLESARTYLFLARIVLGRDGTSGPWETVRMQTWRFEDGMDLPPVEPPIKEAVESSGLLTAKTQPEVLFIKPGANSGPDTIDELRISTQLRNAFPVAE